MPQRPGQYRPQGMGAKRPRRRPSASRRGYTAAWARVSAGFLCDFPLCARCSTPQRPVAAEVTDHIRPHKGDLALFWDSANWQSLCKRCHDRKTAREDGGFGRPVKE